MEKGGCYIVGTKKGCEPWSAFGKRLRALGGFRSVSCAGVARLPGGERGVIEEKRGGEMGTPKSGVESLRALRAGGKGSFRQTWRSETRRVQVGGFFCCRSSTWGLVSWCTGRNYCSGTELPKKG